MGGRLFHRGWQVLAVLGAIGVLLAALMPAAGSEGLDLRPAQATGGGASVGTVAAGGPAGGLGAPGALTTTTQKGAAATSRASSSATGASRVTGTMSTSTSTTSTTLPLFTGEHPLRVLAVGDSLMTYPGYALADEAKVYSGLRVQSITKQSSGLVRPDYYDWPRVLGQAVRQFRPHVVVVLLGANDQQPVLHQGHPASLFSDAWNEEYAKRIDQFIQIATGSGGSVVWVGLPIMRDAKFSNVERRLNALYAAGCAARPGAVYVDGYALFADADGNYAAKLADAPGVVHAMRAKDGIHFTMAGARRIADVVVEVLSRSYRLETDAVERSGAAGG